MEDKVLSFNIGTFAIAVSRKYLMYIALSLTCGIVLFLLLTSGGNYDEERPISTITWKDFRED